MANYAPPSVDENGEPIEPEKANQTHGRPIKELDGEKFRKLFDLYNTIGENGKRLLSKSRFAKEMGVSYMTLDKHLKTLVRDGRLDKIFYDDAVLQVKTHEKIDTPDNILARMGITK